MDELSRRALRNAILRQDLASFIRKTATALDPGTPFLDTWHIHLTCTTLKTRSADRRVQPLERGRKRRMKPRRPGWCGLAHSSIIS